MRERLMNPLSGLGFSLLFSAGVAFLAGYFLLNVPYEDVKKLVLLLGVIGSLFLVFGIISGGRTHHTTPQLSLFK